MNSIILQPSASVSSQNHFEGTIEKLVEQEVIEKHVSKSVLSQIKEIYDDNPVPVWGITPGINDINIKKWNRIKEGDITLFAKNKIIFASGSVTLKFNSSSLAKELWGVGAQGETWEYIYLLDEIKNQEISYENFNNVVGYKPNYIIQGFNILSEDKSEKVFDAFDLNSINYYPQLNLEETEKIFETLDKERVVNQRLEQNYLRSKLFGESKKYKCSVCHEKYPIGFLVAAHIKKREFCTDEEKRDLNHIAVPMCKFGCDDLFERGYISVADGKIITNDKKLLTKPVSKYIDNIIGNRISEWDTKSKIYFEWHSKHHRY